MLHALDLAAVLLVITVIVGLLLSYAGRVALRGRARSERIEQAGGSALLGKGLLEFGYWMLSPPGRLLARGGVTPNMISWTSLALAAVAGAALAAGLYGFACLAAVVSGFLDSLDGMVARLTGRSSAAGEVLDATVDRYAEALFCGGVAVRFHDHPALVAIALSALTACFMVSYSTAKAEAMDIDPPTGLMRRQERAVYLTLGAGFTALLSPWIDQSIHWPGIDLPMVVALALVGVIGNLSAVLRMRSLARSLRRRDGLAPSPSTLPSGSPEPQEAGRH